MIKKLKENYYESQLFFIPLVAQLNDIFKMKKLIKHFENLKKEFK